MPAQGALGGGPTASIVPDVHRTPTLAPRGGAAFRVRAKHAARAGRLAGRVPLGTRLATVVSRGAPIDARMASEGMTPMQ